MAYWVELHCDVLADGPHMQQICVTNRNDSPGVLVKALSDIRPAALKLRETAVKHGWLRLDRVRFACPNCKDPTIRKLAAMRKESS